MNSKYPLAIFILGLILAMGLAGAQVVGTSSIRAPAVIIFNNTGSLTSISVVISKGTGFVNVTGPQTVGASTLQSAYTAAMYASNYTNHNFSDYNFTYSIENAGDNVSGPSAGAAMTVLAVSAFENEPLRTNFTMTGTISSNGTIGEIGGVYDKTGAAKANGMKFILVPKVAPTDPEDELYLLVQTNYGIPLVQVGNVSQAINFAINSSNKLPSGTTYNFYTNYNVNSLPSPTINCTEQCNYTLFHDLLNATFNLTQNDIQSLNANPKYANISTQLQKVLDQSEAISKHGYLYTGADLAFLDYVNTFYFNGYSTNRSSALSLLDNVQSFCDSLSPPPLTKSNYDYVISAELRQTWGNYTINSVVTSYNSSQIDSDEILDELYLGAQSKGWCTAANLVYNETSVNGTYVAVSPTLKTIAINRITRALPYGQSLYLVTAQHAYNQENYPVAILDADYAFALANATFKSTFPTETLDNMSQQIATNATFGVWASEFAKESQFYVSESELANNSTAAKSYAISAYSSALLAWQLSNDTSIISNSLVVSPVPITTSIAQQPQSSSNATTNTQMQALTSDIAYTKELVYALLLLVVGLLVVNIALISVVINKMKKDNIKNTKNTKRRQRK